ncbi:MAG: hypothetical protein SFY67_06575 [Candidatus Melainabacteria bacterium]|nr:hypothetical protein [Candidatus Melainabacteria bacterium]
MRVLAHAFLTLTTLAMGLFISARADEFQDGVVLFKAGRMIEARDVLLSAVKRDPSDLKARYFLANVYASLKDRQKAVEQYNYCANAAPGTKLEEFCLKAMGMQRLKPNSLPALKHPKHDLQLNTELKVDLQAYEYRHNLEKQRANELKGLSSRTNAQADTINRQMALDIDNVPRYIFVGNKRYSNPDYKSDVDSIKLEAARKLDDIANRRNADLESLNQRFDKRLEEYMESRDGIRNALKSANGNMQLTPHGTDMYVRNYMNFGQEKIYEPPQSLQARPLTLLDKIPESSRADKIRQLRRQFQD